MIFISIASSRNPELLATIEDCLRKAKFGASQREATDGAGGL